MHDGKKNKKEEERRAGKKVDFHDKKLVKIKLSVREKIIAACRFKNKNRQEGYIKESGIPGG